MRSPEKADEDQIDRDWEPRAIFEDVCPDHRRSRAFPLPSRALPPMTASLTSTIGGFDLIVWPLSSRHAESKTTFPPPFNKLDTGRQLPRLAIARGLK
jgi:hypothetical protein